jgi:putative membrane protein
MKLNENEKEQIKNAIEDCEKTTSGEVVPMVVQESDFFPATHYRLSIMLILICAFVMHTFFPYHFDAQVYFILIACSAVLGYLLCYIPFIKRSLIFKDELVEEVNQRAIQAFLEHNLHTSRDRTGVLIFVSLLERRVVILADSGINEKVSENTWELIKNDFIKYLKKDELAQGFIKSIEEVGQILTNHFPIKPDDTNELSNKIIEE